MDYDESVRVVVSSTRLHLKSDVWSGDAALATERDSAAPGQGSQEVNSRKDHSLGSLIRSRKIFTMHVSLLRW
jgi:hypothetical protein